MVRPHSFARILAFLLFLTLSASLQADITPSGDVDPTDPLWWIGGGDSSTNAYIGKTAAGSVTVNLGSDLRSSYGYIGYDAGAIGVVTVDGSGSTWTNSGDSDYSLLYVGYEGQGTLNITNGGAVSNISDDYSDTLIGCGTGSIGEVTVDGNGSTLACWGGYGRIYVGAFGGTGELNITDGGSVSNITGLIGRWPGSTGIVTVDGSGSTWTNRCCTSADTYLAPVVAC
ncbi:MAG: hypothetical protein SVV80_02870 [Planctomycetota bacterium]|nr:hypothetical protein [Planctomycetota bacterium]